MHVLKVVASVSVNFVCGHGMCARKGGCAKVAFSCFLVKGKSPSWWAVEEEQIERGEKERAGDGVVSVGIYSHMQGGF